MGIKVRDKCGNLEWIFERFASITRIGKRFAIYFQFIF